MRKLRRCVEHNRIKKERAKRAMMAMLATGIVASDVGALAAYAQNPAGYVSEIEETSDDATGEIDNEGNGETGNEGNGETGNEGNGTDNEGNGENGNEDGEEDNEGTEDGEEGDEESPEDSEEEDTEDIESKDKEKDKDKEEEKEKPLKGARMMLGSPNPANTAEVNRPAPDSTTDISECTISDEKIKVTIDQDGSYTFTGTNEIGGAYVDVSILIESGVTADLYFDDFKIVNDDFDCNETSSIFSAEGLVVNPIVVQGTANVHVMSDSEIKAVCDLFAVSGTLNFVNSEGNATLDCALSKIDRAKGCLEMPQIISQSGEVHFKDANVCFTNQDMYGESYSSNYFYFAKDSVTVCLDGTGLFLADNIQQRKMYTSLTETDLDGLRFSVKNLYDMEGSRIYYMPFSGFPAGSQILQIDFMEGDSSDGRVLDMKQPTGLSADSDGSIPNILVKGDCTYFYIKNGEDIIGYYSYSDGGAWHDGSSRTIVTVKFLDADSGNAELLSYYSLKADSEACSGNNLIFPEEDNKYSYTYELQDGTNVSKDTKVTGDMVIYVSKAEKGEVTVTIDGDSYKVDYGVTLSSVTRRDGYYLNMDSKELVKGDEVITESCSFKTVSLTTTTEDGKEWFILNSAEDMKQFAEIVNYGNGNINGRLTTDVRLDSDFPMIGTIGAFDIFTPSSEVNDNSYCGTFDGQNNTVTLDVHKSDYATGLFGCISTGAMIQNVILEGQIEGGIYTGGIVGVTFSKGGSVTIKNCINRAAVRASGDTSYAGGLIGGNVYAWYVDPGNMKVNISYCGNTGAISSESGRNGGMVGYDNKADIYSCFNADDSNIVGFGTTVTITGSYSRAGSDDVVKPAEAFKSGEVTYLMNKAVGTNKWFQTCGEGMPKFDGDIVYAGYADCHTTELSYANQEFDHTEPGHKDNGEYSYSAGRVIAGCEFCEDDVWAEIDCTTEVLSGNLRGVTVNYSEDWVSSNYPDIVIKYSAEEDGDYVDEVPQSAGEYYLKAYVGDSGCEVAVSDTYTVKARPKNTPDLGSVAGAVNELLTADEETQNEEAEKINELINSITAYVKQNAAKTNKTASSTGNDRTLKIFEYKGTSIPNNLMNAIRDNPDVAIKYECTYSGKKYEFLITAEDIKYFDKSIRWYGPLYVCFYFTLKELNLLSLLW